jgi:hypothetical protein
VQCGTRSVNLANPFFQQQSLLWIWPPGSATSKQPFFRSMRTRLNEFCPSESSVARRPGGLAHFCFLARRLGPALLSRAGGLPSGFRQVALSAASLRPGLPRRRSPGGLCGPALGRQRVPRPKCYAEELSGRCAGRGAAQSPAWPH